MMAEVAIILEFNILMGLTGIFWGRVLACSLVVLLLNELPGF